MDKRYEYGKPMDQLDKMFEGGGRYLSPADREFAFTLMKELEQFQFQAPKDRALMFRPLGGFQRYLIHKVAQTYPKLTSFSIGDDQNRRTVVCFKTKRKNQPVVLPPEDASFGNEYVNSPQRSFESERGRRSAPPARSRDTSRSRKKVEQDLLPSNRGSTSTTHLPKPLRPKKTKRDQMKKSRSLQSSPLLGEEARTLDDRRGRSWSQSGKQQVRSSSLKPMRSSRNKPRTTSPNYSDDERRPRSSHPDVSEHSVKRRSQGLHVEGRVMNGDIEDPYSCRDSESEARVDADAVRRHKERHRRSSRHKATPPPESESSKTESDSEIEITSRHDPDSKSEGGSSTSDSVSTDERPPSYDSLRRSTSLKKAERNLKRIKQVERHHARSGSEESGHSAAGESRMKQSHAKQRSATLPKSTKLNEKKQTSFTKRANTLKAGSNRKKTSGGDKHAAREAPSSSPTRKRSRSSSKHRSTEVNGGKKASRDSLDDLVAQSQPELFHPLPVKKSGALESPLVVDVAENKTQCDGGTQTEFTGTLPKKIVANTPPPPPKDPNLPSSQAKSMGELLAAMMQGLGIHSQANAPFPTPNYNPNMNAFHQHMQNLPPPPSFPPLPPHLVHHLHMSWLGAYYAGATGAWPPPAPPSFIVSSSNQSSGTPFDFLSPNFSAFPKNPNQENDKRSDKKSDYSYYDPMFSAQPPDSPQISDSEEIEKSAPRSFHHNGARADPQPSSHHSISSSLYEPDGGSFAPSDSDASVHSRRSEVTMTTNPKGEVVVCVRSRPGSRSSSVGATPHESLDAETSAPQPDPVPIKSRPHDSKKGKHRPSSLKKRSSSKRDKIGEMTSSAYSKPATEKCEKSVEAHPGEEDEEPADASQEEIILSLRKAPLATIEDDELLSSSGPSSASLNVDELKSTEDHPDLDREYDSESSSSSLHSDSVPAHHVVPVEASVPLPLSGGMHSDEKGTSDEESVRPSPPPHNGAASSDASSISDGNQADDPSDSSYDADQSRAEETNQVRKSSEDQDWGGEYRRFVEIYNFPSSISDIEISRYLTKYRGLRLSRVDKTVALCTLPTPEGANELLKEHFPIFSTRSLLEATEKSRRKARTKLSESYATSSVTH